MSLVEPSSKRTFAEIHELNQFFIKILGRAADAGTVTIHRDIHARLQRRLASTERCPRLPFLLFRLVDVSSDASGIPRDIDGASGLVTLTAGFIWQLAQEDLLLAAVVTGSPASWCAELANSSIAALAEFSTRARLQTRLTDAPGFWQDLTRTRGISALQRASLGPAGLQLILSRQRRYDPAATLAPVCRDLSIQ